MSTSATVSSVITTYNRPEGLRRALTSVGVQDVDGHEVVLVNDGGPDVTAIVDEVRQQTSATIRLINLSVNLGLSAARKVGIAATEGQYVAFLDDDDIWLPHHLRTALAGLGDENVDAVYTTCLVAHSLAQPGQVVPSRHRFDHPFNPDLLAVTNLTPVISVVTRRFDPHDAALNPGDVLQEDYALWLGLVFGHDWRMRHLNTPTTVYHRISQAASMTGDAATTIAGSRRFEKGQRLLHERWPVEPASTAGVHRELFYRMYEVLEARLSAGLPTDMYYYERTLRLLRDSINGDLSRKEFEAQLALVADPATGPASTDEEVLW
ncbi:glycosyltransferase family 2 protein [Kineosporia sp. J2-2]|uniref:Glycosyltransferase family 2 protein n=1 Tax=Kineosporia corallincola TaxID=2835133 RepID=A0ABS5TSG6_9ACTN|nr:glycosyltransferase family 2 protein [Kineosporia corallincola]MBT0773720.1 glycosyltransferase family 2 protein [Kineosporia corallincola]